MSAKKKTTKIDFKDSLRIFLKKIYNYFFYKKINFQSLLAPYDFLVSHYSYPATTANYTDKVINWVIPSFDIGAGGHLNIFRFIAGLEKSGYECQITIVGPCLWESASNAKEMINKYFIPLKATLVIGHENMKPAWNTIATSWITAYYVRNFPYTKHKCYFIQDFEPHFYPVGSDYFLVEQTYKFGFYGITAGHWLSDIVNKNYGMKAKAFSFSFDKDLYFQSKKQKQNKKRVFFYARPPTPRRMFELGLLVLNEVAKKIDNVEFLLAGWDLSGYEIPPQYKNLGVVDLKSLNSVYSDCDVALVLSATNLSLLPLELMASGCPIVSNTGANVEWLLNSQNSVLCEPSVPGLTEGLLSVLKNKELAEKLTEQGLNFANSTSWDKEIEKVVTIMNSLDMEMS